MPSDYNVILEHRVIKTQLLIIIIIFYFHCILIKLFSNLVSLWSLFGTGSDVELIVTSLFSDR